MNAPARTIGPDVPPRGAAPERLVLPCTWCGTEVELRGVRAAEAHVAREAGESVPVYCCSGCEAAAAMVSGAGLEQYFEKRDALPPRPGLARSAGWDRIPARQAADGTLEATLHVDGLRCAACTWVTENVLQDSPDIVEAHVSYGSGTATVRWKPGADPDDKTALTEALTRVSRLGYRPRSLDSQAPPDRDLLVRMGVAVFAAMNVMMILAGVYLGWISGMAEHYAALFRWVTLVLATPVALYSAAPFFRGAWEGLRNRVLHMDLPIAIAVGGMYAHGVWATFAGKDSWLDSMTMLVALLLAGRFLEQQGRRKAAEAAQALAAEAPAVARRVTPTGVEPVDPTDLQIGDVIEVAAGEELAADGEVISGRGRVQLALLTGESEPVDAAPGRRVIAGGVVVDGNLRVRVDSAVGESLLARMADMLREAAARPPAPTAADKLAPWFTGLTLLIAGGTLLSHGLFGSGWEHAVEATVAVLVVACPCALALAAPLAAHAGLGAAARRGLLLRSGDAVRRAAEVDVVALDKTGTVTWGRPRVVAADDEVLRVAAGIERASVHPLALAIVDEAAARGIPIPLGEDIVELPGRGISGVVDGRRWEVRSGGAGVVEVRELGPRGGRRLGTIHLRDRIRDEVRDSLAALQADGVEIALITGDHADVAEEIAKQAGVDTVLAGQSPEDKARWIEARSAAGHTVMFVGDGLNDGPALAAADVGIAMGHGAASSVLVADGVLVGGQIAALRAGLVAARAAARVTRVNILRSIAYNVGAVGLALVGLINPLIAAVLMPLSSGLVIAGALSVERRTRTGLDRGRHTGSPS